MLNWYFLEDLKQNFAWESVAISDFNTLFSLKRTYDFALKQKNMLSLQVKRTWPLSFNY